MFTKHKCIILYSLILTLLFILPLKAQPLQQWIGNINPTDQIYRNGPVGINNNNPREMLEIGGRIRIGNALGTAPAGTMRWNGTDFQGYNGSEWKSLTSKWTVSGSNIINNNTGHVQLGTASKLGIGRAPNSKLEIYAVNPGSSWTTGLQLTASGTGDTPSEKSTYLVQHNDGFYIKSDGGYNFMNSLGTVNFMHISNDGKVGISTTSPTTKVEVNGGVFINAGSASIDLFKLATTSTENLPVLKMGVDNNKRSNLSMGYWTLPQAENPMGYVEQAISFTAGSHSYILGSLSLGKTTIGSSYLFDVNGKIRANEIVVNTTGADFVFENDYKLQSLEELEIFIKENKHLPDIPTAKEVEENGVSLGEMQTKLLQKIEELTLYIIEQEKRIRELEGR